jgi:hypothetical protein
MPASVLHSTADSVLTLGTVDSSIQLSQSRMLWTWYMLSAVSCDLRATAICLASGTPSYTLYALYHDLVYGLRTFAAAYVLM